MQRTYFQGLKLKPSFDQIVGYLENDQQFMAHPDRTYTRLKNDQYYSNLNMAGVNSINAQSDNLLKEQAKQLNRTQQMQTLGLSQPQVAAANIASGMSTPMGTPMGQQTQQFYMGSPQRPLFLPDQVPLTPGRSSVGAFGFSTPLDPDVVRERLEVVAKQKEAEQGAKLQPIQAEVAGEALARDSAKNMLSGIYGRVQQPSSSSGAEPVQQVGGSSGSHNLPYDDAYKVLGEVIGKELKIAPLSINEVNKYLETVSTKIFNPFTSNASGARYEPTKFPTDEAEMKRRWLSSGLNVLDLQLRIFSLDHTYPIKRGATRRELVDSYFEMYHLKNLKHIDRSSFNPTQQSVQLIESRAQAKAKAKAKAQGKK
jgi:hypothetical protein